MTANYVFGRYKLVRYESQLPLDNGFSDVTQMSRGSRLKDKTVVDTDVFKIFLGLGQGPSDEGLLSIGV